MKYKLLIFIKLPLMICLTISCQLSKVINNPQLKVNLEETQISMERTGCFGDCPVYKLTIFGDGTVDYEGIRFVETLGYARDKISQEKVNQLIFTYENANYFNLRDEYKDENDGCDRDGTDSPHVITSIKVQGRTKSISHYLGCFRESQLKNITSNKTPVVSLFYKLYPQELLTLEDKIDEIVNSNKWVKEYN